MSYLKILLPQLHIPELDYILEGDMSVVPGDLVLVPFRNKEVTGIVLSVEQTSNVKKLKEITAKLDLQIDKSIIDFLYRASKYYMVPVGSIAKLVLPVELSEGRKSKIENKEEIFSKTFLPQLSKEQIDALEEIKNHKNTVVLKGITGSGKTEVYFHLIYEVLKAGKQILLMLPEIALSSQIIERFKDRFGFEPFIWNSTITKSKKRNLLKNIILGEAKVIIGTRSALFLPYSNLGLIVVDEEHDASYKQEDGVLYNARDMAVMRGALLKIKVILASATPSIETLYNVKSGKYKIVNLNSRFGEAILPDVAIIDMRLQNMDKGKWISYPLKSAIKDAISKKEQAMIFLNRRGYAPMMLCKSCGYRVTCDFCSSWLVMHKSKNRLECHHCGYSTSIITSCSECLSEDSLVACGPGVERVAEEAAKIFPEANIQIITKDEMKSENDIKEILERIDNNDIDILIGTQIITKGYHFPKLSIVGVIDSDLGLNGGDLKASERSFQLLYQVSGRAGREKTKGKVFLQSFAPESLLISLLKDHEFDKFMDHELQTRVDSNMPPITKMAALLISGPNEDKTMIEAKKITRLSPKCKDVRILGPVPALLSKLQNQYRYRILLIADRKIDIQLYISKWIQSYKLPSNINMKIDIDPYIIS